MKNNVVVYAHRGASGVAPENTMTAYKKALEMGSQGIECDVQLSKDGQLIICHDERLERTTNGKGFIKDMDLADLRKLDAGSWFSSSFRGERLPLLTELLSLIRQSGKKINIEIKSGIILYEGIEEKTVKEIKAHGLAEQTIISSFNHYSLQKVKELAPEIKTGALYMEGLFEPWNYLKSFKCNYAHPFYPAANPEVIAAYKSRGFGINVFTIDDDKAAKGLAALGIDGIITNYPDRMLKALGS